MHLTGLEVKVEHVFLLHTDQPNERTNERTKQNAKFEPASLGRKKEKKKTKKIKRVQKYI